MTTEISNATTIDQDLILKSHIDVKESHLRHYIWILLLVLSLYVSLQFMSLFIIFTCKKRPSKIGCHVQGCSEHTFIDEPNLILTRDHESDESSTIAENIETIDQVVGSVEIHANPDTHPGSVSVTSKVLSKPLVEQRRRPTLPDVVGTANTQRSDDEFLALKVMSHSRHEM